MILCYCFEAIKTPDNIIKHFDLKETNPLEAVLMHWKTITSELGFPVVAAIQQLNSTAFFPCTLMSSLFDCGSSLAR